MGNPILEDKVLVPAGTEFPPSPPETVIEGRSEKPTPEPSEADDTIDFVLPPPTTIPTTVLDLDKKTPDSHVPRDPRLIRLTGIHPFNVEAPLSDLYNEGFLTSPELFYVRNHGPVPEVKDEDIPDWEFTVEGLVDNPLKITLKELIAEYEQKTYPVTLACAGNRRKEQNIVKKTKGFSWGPAGCSTALFTGVILGDVIRKALPSRKAKYLCMEGADHLPNGHYGTSVKLNWAMDPNKGMMLAHKMNGEMLRPDHGKPLRVVIPGQIGGRSVKWLKKLVLTEGPSENWYHIYDNRVLPTMVSPDEAANNPEWWKDERYAIYDLNTQSAIAYPAHDEQLRTVHGPETYRVKGYAYGGGGRRVTRVEISLDQGKTWRLSNIEYAEDKYRDAPDQDLFGGKLDMWWRESSFCWCFWHLDIPTAELRDTKDIVVRAMDDSMNVQPRDLYWSVLGMLNNPWFRIVVHQEGDFIRFEHPTQPALMTGGWMERVKKAGGNITNGFWGEKLDGEPDGVPADEAAQDIKMTNDKVDRIITFDEFKENSTEEQPWIVINGQVYDPTKFLDEHPGGGISIVAAAGQDCSEEFLGIHSETAKAQLVDWHIGTLDEASRKRLSEGESEEVESSEPRPVFLDARHWSKAILHDKVEVSPDTRIFTYRLQHDQQKLGLPTGQHLMVRLRDPVTREAILRSYTPISESTGEGYMRILMKIYFDTKERPGGKMGLAMNSLPIGHSVDFKGPIGKFEYLGRGVAAINGHQRTIKKFIMVCGGSGITPIYQVFRAVMQDKDDPTTCTVLNGNRLAEDVLLKEELDKFAADNADRAKMYHTLSKAPEDWKGLRGRIGPELLKEHASKQDDTMVLVCGPEALEKSTHATLLEMGWTDDKIMFF